jgi:hypothetical protein
METRSTTLARCEEAWKTGVPLKVTSDGFPIVMKPSMNCEYKVAGTNDIAYVGLPEDPNDLLAYLKTIPHLTATDVEEAEPGVYTWILASKEGQAPSFFATRTLAMLELGTVHYALATSLGATRVHGAGELWKHGEEVTVNFLSGTFMDKWELPKDCPLKTMQAFLKSKLQTEVFPYLFRGKQLTVDESGKTFINNRLLDVLSTYELDEWTKAGFKVCVYGFDPKTPDDRERAHKECKSTRAACKKPVEVVMKGGNDRPLVVEGQQVPMSPRKAYMNRTSSDDGSSQAAKARLVFASQGLIPEEKLRTAKERAVAALKRPISPGSVGLGRKTKKVKKARRKTRRVSRRS